MATAAIGVLAVSVGAGAIALGERTSGRAAGPPPSFVDETVSSGLEFRYDGGFPYVASGGVAVFDCDGDGRQDLYLAGGEQPAALFHNDSEIGGALRFTHIRSDTTDLVAVNGAYPIDIDGDGQADLVVLRYGENVVLRGGGDCTFERANEAWGIDGGDDQTHGFSATWEPGNAWPTLAFGNYVQPGDFDLDRRCRPNLLFRPTAGDDGVPAYGEPIELAPGYCALSMLFSDWSGTGRADLRISNDRAYYRQTAGQEQLWRIEPNRPPVLYGEADGWARVQVEGMGIGSYDLTGDGRPEVYLTSQAASKLQTLADGATGPAYRDIGLPRNVNVAHPFIGADTDLPSTAWHPEFDDVNNDGLIDLFVSKGNVDEQPDFAMEDPSNLLLGQPDGTFLEAADQAGVVVMDRGRGAALVDLNLDGRLDLVESFYKAAARVWRNTGPTGGADGRAAHWLMLRLRQPGPNVDAIGAVLEVRAGDSSWRRELTIGGGHGGGELGWLHVGLGVATNPEVRVTWPGAAAGGWQAVGVDSFTIVDREGGLVPWTPPAG